jgi:hypothetical protein
MRRQDRTREYAEWLVAERGMSTEEALVYAPRPRPRPYALAGALVVEWRTGNVVHFPDQGREGSRRGAPQAPSANWPRRLRPRTRRGA